VVAVSSSTQEVVTTAERSAADQILTMFGRFIGVGYVFYLLVSIPLIRDLEGVSASWWTPVGLVLFFGPGLALGAASFGRRGQRALRPLAAACAVVFLLGLLTWPLGWTGETLPDGKAAWFSLFPALASLGAAVSMRPRWAFLHLAVAVTGVQLVNHYLRDAGDRSPLVADIVYSFGFSLIFVAASITASRTGFLLDRTRESTYAQAASSAAVQARTVERRRFDGLIHDNVMSTLLAASRGPMDQRLVDQASVALAELDTLRRDALPVSDFEVQDVVAHLRAAAAAVDASATLSFRFEADAAERTVPAETVRTVGAAMAEAMRNSLRHAGPDAHRSVVAALSPLGLRVTVTDDGPGFDLSSIPAHRLGVRVSILDRMHRLPGGSAALHTAVGRGTVVELRWEAQ
jgi:signal transduction histidine kinase